jgi:hypothetical protein
MVDGGSYGGYMVLASMIHFGKELCCGVERVGISNFVTFLENTSAYRRDNVRCTTFSLSLFVCVCVCVGARCVCVRCVCHRACRSTLKRTSDGRSTAMNGSPR